jgi:hypothetical protein
MACHLAQSEETQYQEQAWVRAEVLLGEDERPSSTLSFSRNPAPALGPRQSSRHGPQLHPCGLVVKALLTLPFSHQLSTVLADLFPLSGHLGHTGCESQSICMGSHWPSVSSTSETGRCVLFSFLFFFFRKSMSWACSWKEDRPGPCYFWKVHESVDGGADLGSVWGLLPIMESECSMEDCTASDPLLRNRTLMPIKKMWSSEEVTHQLAFAVSWWEILQRPSWENAIKLWDKTSFSHSPSGNSYFSLFYFYFLY